MGSYLKHSAECFKYPAWCFHDPVRCFFVQLGFWLKNIRQGLYIKNFRESVLKHPVGCLHFKHPAGHFTYAFEVWLWNYLRHIRWFLYFYISENVRGFWNTSLRLGTVQKVELHWRVTFTFKALNWCKKELL